MDPKTRETLADLLLAWDDAFRAGQDLPAADVARDYPVLIEPLAQQIRALKQTFWIDHPPERPDNEADPPSPGGRLLAGRYRLDDRIAVGGFAEVWRAFDTELQRVVAVKIPKAARIGMQDAFLAEARRVARLRHPAIVPVHDVGIAGNACFIVSEFMDGGSLADRLTKEPLEPAVALRWMVQIAAALDFAHRNGIVHRDVKPANILINHHGDAVLADFGIAQSATKNGEFAPSAGTLRYMSPEQKTGGAVDHAADIYSLGIVLHETMTGATPCSGDASTAIRSEFRQNRAPWISPALPPRIAAVCQKALRWEPAHRHSTAAEFAADLRTAAAHDSRGWIRLGLAAFALIGVVLFMLWRGMPVFEKSRTVVREPRVNLVVPAPKSAPTIHAKPGLRTALVEFRRIAEAQPYVVASRDVASYSEWQDPPDTYVGPLRNDVVCFVVYRFDFAEPIMSGTLIAETRCWDFTTRPGGFGRGVAAVDVSSSGVDWIAVRDSTVGPEWGKGWTIKESLPVAVLGGTSLWVRARFLTNGSPNASYTVAQFGRNREEPSQPTFGIIAELRSVPLASPQE